MSTNVKIWLTILLVATLSYGAWAGYQIWKTIEESKQSAVEFTIKPERPLADFEFTERSGRKVGLKELEGKIFVVNFFWANCPMSCRKLNETVAEIQKEFKDTDIQFVSITVEPTIDTPARLKAYADSLNAPADKWWFLNAPLSETQDLGNNLKVNVAPSSHTDAMVVVDRAGKVAGAYDFKDVVKLESCKKKLRKLLVDQPIGWKPTGTAEPAATSTPTASATATAAATPSATAASSAAAKGN
jgi:cytochrome oxidase Cu insertion factor (SCO1/SenC/PrrC family)